MSTAAPLLTARQKRFSLRRDYGALFKVRVTTLIVVTAWSGAYFAAARADVSWRSVITLNAMLGIGLVAAGAAGLNEVMERERDAKMRRTSMRPLVTGAMSVWHATGISTGAVLLGTVYLGLACNLLTALLTLLTAAVYLGAYTPMKTVGPSCTFIGAFPGAMPPVLGWVAVRGRVDWEALALFAIIFLWQFPHFHSIALLYRSDYERAGIRMLPVVDVGGRATPRALVLYSSALIPATLVPVLLGMSGWIYGGVALLLGFGLLRSNLRIWRTPLHQPQLMPQLARQVLRATIVYLPVLLAVMVLDRR